jgi:putative heme-binding domain-containing protein
MIRRIGAGGDATGLLIDALAKTPEAGTQLTFLTAIREALKGRRTVPMPQAWPTLFGKFQNLSVNDERRQQATCLAVTFGNPAPALDMVKGRGNTANQAAAISALLDAGHPKLTPELHWLLDSELKGTQARRIALRGLAAYDDKSTPNEILRRMPDYTPDEKSDALNTLASRPSFAKALLDAVAKKQLAATDVSADVVRQLRNLKDKDVSARINEVWGLVRESAEDRKKLMADYKTMLTTPAKTEPDLAQGRKLFEKSCAQCHTLFGVGGKVGPDLTGSNRANLDYLLENIIDPSAVIPKEYAASVVETKDGRTLTGIVRSDTKVALTLVTVNETLVLPRGEVDAVNVSKISMMPDDLLKQLSEGEVRSLIAYLQSPVQVMAAGKK